MKANKGEWSELYTFFKLLAEGKLFSADENLEKTESFVQLLSIYRKDAGKNLDFNISSKNNINIIDSDTKQIILSFPQSKANIIADKLVNEIKE